MALICRRNPQDSFSTKWRQRKSCPANDKGGKWSHFLTSCFIQVETSPHFLACALLGTAHGSPAAPRASPFDLRHGGCQENYGFLGQGRGASTPPSLLLSLLSLPPSLTSPSAYGPVRRLWAGALTDSNGSESPWNAGRGPARAAVCPRVSSGLGPLIVFPALCKGCQRIFTSRLAFSKCVFVTQ